MKDNKQYGGIGFSFLALVGVLAIAKVIHSIYKRESENNDPILISDNSEEDENEILTLKVIPEDAQTEMTTSVEIPEVVEAETITLIEISEDETDRITAKVAPKVTPKEQPKKLPKELGKNSWLYPTDEFGMMEKGKVE